MRRAACGRGPAGLTLVELMAVLVVLALAIALVVPRLGGLVSRAGLELAQSRIVDSLTVARALCRQSGEPLLVVYEEHAVRLVPREPEAQPSSLIFRLPEGTGVVAVLIGSRHMPTADGPVELTMRATGLCPHHGVVLAGREERTSRVLVIDGLTGEIRTERERTSRVGI